MPDLSDAFDRLFVSYLPSALVLTVFVTTIASIRAPRVKVLVFSMPIRFTCAYLSTGSIPINATHMAGLFLAVLYHWIVFGVRERLKVPLGVGIAAGVGFYLAAASLARPLAGWPFWPLAIVWVAIYLVAARSMRGVDEPGHRSTAPWQVEAPTIFAIALVVYVLRDLLAGAVTTFPYAGVFTSYDMRKNLRTLATQFTINVISIASMIGCMYATQHHLSGYWSLVAGWVAVFTSLGVIYGLGIGKPPSPPTVTDPTTPTEDARSPLAVVSDDAPSKSRRRGSKVTASVTVTTDSSFCAFRGKSDSLPRSSRLVQGLRPEIRAINRATGANRTSHLF